MGVHYISTIGRWVTAISKQCSNLGNSVVDEKDGIEKDVGRAAELHSRAID